MPLFFMLFLSLLFNLLLTKILKLKCRNNTIRYNLYYILFIHIKDY